MAEAFKITLMVAAVVLTLAAAYSVRWILLVATIGIGAGTLIVPLLHRLHSKLRIPRSLGALVFLILWMCILGGIGFLIYYLVWGQLGPFLTKFPDLLNTGRDRLADLLNRFPTLSGSLRKIDWGALVQNGAGTAFHSVTAGVRIVAFTIYMIAISLYLAMHSERYESSILSLFPKRIHHEARRVLEASAQSLRRWFTAQLIAMASVGTCASIGFIIIGTPYWLGLGLLTGILDIIPFVGPTIAAICALLVTLASDPSKAIWVLVNFVIVEHIESNLVIPMVMKGQIDLPPVHLLTLMLIFAEWFGILGVLVAPPILCVLRTIYLLVYMPSINAGKLNVAA